MKSILLAFACICFDAGAISGGAVRLVWAMNGFNKSIPGGGSESSAEQ
jgi:hypothetical protein